jgi:hypothetical protein
LEEANGGVYSSGANNNRTDEFEFEKIMQQVLKESKDEFEIQARRDKDAELQMIS